LDKPGDILIASANIPIASGQAVVAFFPKSVPVD
jgi:hypothetical protein